MARDNATIMGGETQFELEIFFLIPLDKYNYIIFFLYNKIKKVLGNNELQCLIVLNLNYHYS
jgi:hypothetical protein